MIFSADVRAMRDMRFWRSLAPDLSICESPASDDEPPREQPVGSDLASIAGHLHEHGYFHLPAHIDAAKLAPLRQALDALQGAGIPAVFIYMYDEPWALLRGLSPLIQYFLGDQFALLPNFWAWNIPLTDGAGGWPPHQDCQAQTRFTGADDATDSVLISLSLWVPLSDATIHNGCLSVLPRALSDQVPPDGSLSDELLAQGIHLPAEAGAVLGWTQDLYHWSNQVTDQAVELRHPPRMSLSLEFQNTAFEPLSEPLLNIYRAPSFTDRIGLIALQIPKYHHMEPLSFDVSELLD